MLAQTSEVTCLSHNLLETSASKRHCRQWSIAPTVPCHPKAHAHTQAHTHARADIVASRNKFIPIFLFKQPPRADRPIALRLTAPLTVRTMDVDFCRECAENLRRFGVSVWTAAHSNMGMGPQPIDYLGEALASQDSSFSDKLVLIFRPYRILTPEGEILKFS